VRRQDRLPVSLHYLGLSRLRTGIHRLLKSPIVRILAFHDIADHLAQEFRAEIAMLKERTNVISLDDLFAGRVSPMRINVAITFDDGYRSWIDHAGPALRELGVPATFFVSSGLVGRSIADPFWRNNVRCESVPTGSLDFAGIRGLAQQGFTIGSHTKNHVNVGEVNDETELRRELVTDKAALEAMTGARVDYFAYPFGTYQNSRIDVVRLLRESGFRGAVTTVSGPNTPATDRFLLRRDLVNPGLSRAAFAARVFGNHDPVMFVRRVLRT
jgi:peptidoglycan/xylan/chitin deacetylase (PgdA/CDA1 family)